MVYLNDVEEGGETEFFTNVKIQTDKESSSYFQVLTHIFIEEIPLMETKYVLAMVHWETSNMIKFSPVKRIITNHD